MGGWGNEERFSNFTVFYGEIYLVRGTEIDTVN